MSFEFIDRTFIFSSLTSQQITYEYPTYVNFPVVYIIYSESEGLAYVGESTNIPLRIKQHLGNEQKKGLKNIKVIFSHFFNKSAVWDIESNLIKYMGADGTYKLLNGNDGISGHHYYQRQQYHEVFKNIWSGLKLNNLVKTDLLDIENSDLFKFSPYKKLSDDQYLSLKAFLEFTVMGKTQTAFFEGSAGTGKTILAIYLIKLLLNNVKKDDLKESSENNSLIELANKAKLSLFIDPENPKIALVVPVKSLRKTLKGVFKSIYGLSPKMVIGPSEVTKLKDKYDLLIVDESHRLKRRKNLVGYGAFDTTNIEFGLDKLDGTELDWVVLSSRSIVFFYDDKQSIKPSDVPKVKFDQIKDQSTVFKLKSQMRVQGGSDYIEFVDKLLSNSESLIPWISDDYEVKLFENIHEFVEAIKQKEAIFGLCRTISGYSWEWLSKKDKTQPDITIDGIEFFWNRTDEDWINSTKDVCEMGCIHTTQGYDLNYAGIIFGSDITYNEYTQKIEIIPSNYFDKKGKAGASEIELHDYILNIYKTIMYRGIKGTYVFCFDKKLESYFKKYIPV
ncbi:DUF2075 domain-containing protein [Thiosulfativibrio zosterae]|uniref:GIY-YIG domain-containing protein n=1 Tax=Thiosulfativibrio zosterae TaxID=2675053 RepID=A0A6F8PNA1_9GAMM|nr:DUF2075 domain-containing protein [Thiosulfativibrio zosterae]BBP43528.1 hypothetical protein THMIRHAT_12740 [Thiosulfativibrio zosterae]